MKLQNVLYWENMKVENQKGHLVFLHRGVGEVQFISFIVRKR